MNINFSLKKHILHPETKMKNKKQKNKKNTQKIAMTLNPNNSKTTKKTQISTSLKEENTILTKLPNISIPITLIKMMNKATITRILPSKTK